MSVLRADNPKETIMTTLTEKEYLILQAQCTAALAAPGIDRGGSPSALITMAAERAAAVISECGILRAGSEQSSGSSVEPKKCKVCKEYIWPHERTAFMGALLVHEKCNAKATL